MDWAHAIEKNTALKSILATLVALVGMTGDAEPNAGGKKTLPRHLHRYVLRLVRPAEAATRRLIFIAARGLVVKIRPYRPRKPKPAPEPRVVYALDRVNGSIVNVPIVLPEPPPAPKSAGPAKPNAAPVFPLLDPIQAIWRSPEICQGGRHAEHQASGRRG